MERDVFSIDTEAGLFAASKGSLRAFLWESEAYHRPDRSPADMVIRFCMPPNSLEAADHCLGEDFAQRNGVYFAGEISRREAAQRLERLQAARHLADAA